VGLRFAPLFAMRVVLLALLALVTACNQLDCFDQGELEAAYHDGGRAAQTANAANYDRGRADGLALKRPAGERDGNTEGYAAGHDAGYHSTAGYPAGYSAGTAPGQIAGLADPAACTTGAGDGYADGRQAGYSDAFDTASGDAYDIGYDAGFADGVATCADGSTLTGNVARTDSAAPADTLPRSKDARVCYGRGFDAAMDVNAYARGLDDGKRANPDYQAGYHATYPAAFAHGQGDGITAGYQDGYEDGYRRGYDDGYAVNYDACYEGAHAHGYDAGYADGWDAGYSSGYDDGYTSGYDDGDDCP
jgi:hypothetical protein